MRKRGVTGSDKEEKREKKNERKSECVGVF